jgi:putative tricarboxylic transport membrane protein
LLPTLAELRQCTAPILRTSALGFLMGLLPGMSPGIVSFISYGMERRLAREPEPEPER